VVLNDESLGFHLEDGRFISVPVAFIRRSRWPRRRNVAGLKSTVHRFIGRSWMPTSESRACSPGRGNIITTRAKRLNAPFVWEGCPKRLWKKLPAFRCNLLDGFAEGAPDDLPPTRREKYEPSGRIIL